MTFIQFGPLNGRAFVQNYNRPSGPPTIIQGHQIQDGGITIDKVKVQDTTTGEYNVVDNHPLINPGLESVPQNNQQPPLNSSDVLNFLGTQAEQNIRPQFSQNPQQGGVVDKREAEVAQRLNVPVEEFHELSEQQKQEMVAQYNQENPSDKIPDKAGIQQGAQSPFSQGIQSYFNQNPQQGGAVDKREAEVAQRLNVPVGEFHELSEQQKQEMVAQYNHEHPNNPIPDKIR